MKIINFLRRYIKNLVTLNNLKFRVDILEEQNSSLKSEVTVLQEQNEALKREIQEQNEALKREIQEQNEALKREIQEQNQIVKIEIDYIKNSIESAVAKQIFYQSLSLGQRVDQFIFDANIEISRKITSKD